MKQQNLEQTKANKNRQKGARELSYFLKNNNLSRGSVIQYCNTLASSRTAYNTSLKTSVCLLCNLLLCTPMKSFFLFSGHEPIYFIENKEKTLRASYDRGTQIVDYMD